ncbi:GTPase Der [Buchnera aphidicola (Periphyllus testudinaceus)]|uniref:ribosome biogenesis GTPase Der n=1 Tax=Buchnera aphidicola TaxID=9 RepID=UPI003464506C
MTLTISLIGCQNVGKSTIFNNLIKKKKSLVLKKYKGITRDRQKSFFLLNNYYINLIDTAGFFLNKKILKEKILFQINLSIQESDIVFFIISSIHGFNNLNYKISQKIRKLNKKVIVIINEFNKKIDDFLLIELYKFGFKKIYKISAINLNDINFLKKKLIKFIKKDSILKYNLENNQKKIKKFKNIIKISVIGRPNSGKSTLINRLIKDNSRLITSNISGTTQDTILVSTFDNNIKYNFFDTPGIRKKSKIKNFIEKEFIKKTLKTLKKVDITLLVIDATEKIISNQDLILSNLIFKNGCSMIVLVNKWDLLNKSEKIIFKKTFYFRFRFIKNIQCNFLSFLFKKKIRIMLLKLIKKMYLLTTKKFNSSFLTKVLKEAVNKQKPSICSYNKNRAKLKYAHSGGINPPIIVIHGNKLNDLSISYKKYLNNFFQSKLNIFGIPLLLQFKNSKNPFILNK